MNSETEIFSILEGPNFRPRESVRSLVLESVGFVDAAQLVRFISAFPNLEEILLNSLCFRESGRYAFIQPGNRGSEVEAAGGASRNADLGKKLSRLSKLEIGSANNQQQQNILNPILFPPTPYPMLQKIAFAHAPFAPDFFADLHQMAVGKNPPLRFLDVENTSTQSLPPIAFSKDYFPPKMLRHLHFLNVGGRLGSLDPLPYFKKVRVFSLRSLRLNDARGFGDGALKYLVEHKKFSDLHSLSAGRTGITPQGIKSIATLKQLDRFVWLDLSLPARTFSEGSLKELIKRKNIQDIVYLNLKNLDLDEGDLEALANWKPTSLSELVISTPTKLPQKVFRNALEPLIQSGVIVRVSE